MIMTYYKTLLSFALVVGVSWLAPNLVRITAASWSLGVTRIEDPRLQLQTAVAVILTLSGTPMDLSGMPQQLVDLPCILIDCEPCVAPQTAGACINSSFLDIA